MSKRVKISFQRDLVGTYTVIDPKDIAETNRRIKKEMTPIIREFEKKQFESWLLSSKKIKL
jgi:hypothetical protein